MLPSSKIFIAGHRGPRRLRSYAETSRKRIHIILLERSRKELDLTNQHAVEVFFAYEKPEYVFLAAAKVGGIHANSTYPAEFIFSNMQVQMNIINESWKYKVKKILFLGSSLHLSQIRSAADERG